MSSADGHPVVRATACLVAEVRLTGTPDWAPGPLPVRPAGISGQELVVAEPANQSNRLTYFESRVAESLYGRPDRPSRWWRRGDPAVRLSGAVVDGIEVVRLPFTKGADGGAALAVVHVRLDRADPAGMLAGLVATGAKNDLAALLPTGTRVVSGRLQTLAHVTFAGEMPAPSGDYAGWPPYRQWAWLLASATPFADVPPDPDDPTLFDGEVRLSRDWTALVLRNGAAFVGRTPDAGPDSFHRAAETYVHSLYLDVLLLGRMQLHALNDFANRVATAVPQRQDPVALAELDHRLVEIRRGLWGRHTTVQGRIGNDLLDRYREQHRLADLMGHVETDMANATRYLDALTNRSVSAALGLLTVIGLPFGLAYAGGAIWADPSPRLFWTCTALATAAAVLLAVLLPPVLPMVRSLRRPRPS